MAARNTGMGVLEPLGIADLEERLYNQLLDQPGADVSELTAVVGLPRRRVEDALRALEDKGLASRSPTRPIRFLPAAPETALEVLILRRQQALHVARAQAAQLQRRFVKGSERASSPLELIEVVTGEPAVLQRYRQLRAMAQQEVLSFDKPPYTADLAVGADLTITDLQRGVKFRTVLDPSALDLQGRAEQIKRAAAAGEQLRIGTVPMKLAIADQRIAIVPLRIDVSERGSMLDGLIVVHSSPLLEALARLFDLVWTQAATPMLSVRETEPSDRALDATDRDILLLLVGGAKDESIARTLGLADRTVGRRVSLMMASLNAQTRFQLGMQAVKRGWVE